MYRYYDTMKAEDVGITPAHVSNSEIDILERNFQNGVIDEKTYDEALDDIMRRMESN